MLSKRKYFGESKSEASSSNENNKEEAEEEALDDEEYKRDEEHLQKIKSESGFAHWLFHKLFHTDIFKKIRLAHKTSKDIWKGRPPPNPLVFSSIEQDNIDPAVVLFFLLLCSS